MVFPFDGNFCFLAPICPSGPQLVPKYAALWPALHKLMISHSLFPPQPPHSLIQIDSALLFPLLFFSLALFPPLTLFLSLQTVPVGYEVWACP